MADRRPDGLPLHAIPFDYSICDTPKFVGHTGIEHEAIRSFRHHNTDISPTDQRCRFPSRSAWHIHRQYLFTLAHRAPTNGPLVTIWGELSSWMILYWPWTATRSGASRHSRAMSDTLPLMTVETFPRLPDSGKLPTRLSCLPCKYYTEPMCRPS